MTLHLHSYAELPAPLPVALELCAARPPLDAQPAGDYWLWRGGLWRFVARRFADGRLVWTATATGSDERLVIGMTLLDGTISTYARVHLTLERPSARWQHLTMPGLRGRLRRSVRDGLAQLQAAAAELAPAPRAADTLPPEPAALAEALRATHPHTVAAFEQMDALASLAAVAQLERRWRDVERGSYDAGVYRPVAALPAADAHFDLIYAGGGLGLLHAAVMAQRYGYRVLVFDRGTIGATPREWNISDSELQALIDTGFAGREELERIVMRRYDYGVVRFQPEPSVRPAELHMPDVLNVALDASALLRLARSRLEQAGATVLDSRALRTLFVAPAGSVVAELGAPGGGVEHYGARLLLDGMGATSPLALRRFAGLPFAGICPTVGSVVCGLARGSAPDQHNPDVGDVLVSVADAQRGRQLIWEGFAGRDDELTVYVFYYDVLGNPIGEPRTKNQEPRALRKSSRTGGLDDGGSQNRARRSQPWTIGSRFSVLGSRFSVLGSWFSVLGSRFSVLDPPQHHSLLDLFEDYFQLLPTYKRPGPEFRHLRPVYGYIPARHTQRRSTVPMLPGVLPVGDSSAQQSPLTFTGFGSHVRNLDRTTSLLDWALRRDLLAPEQLGLLTAYQSNVALNWVFSRFMQPWDAPSDVNRLQNIFARVLNELGQDVAVRFFRDRMSWRDYGRIVNHTLAVYHGIIPTALRVLGPRDTARWALDWLRFSRAAAQASLGRAAGTERLDALERRLEALRPALALRLKALRAEWRAMGWDAAVPRAKYPSAEVASTHASLC